MSADGATSVFCFTPLRVPVEELLREPDLARSPSDGAAATSRAAVPPATGPCPVCPLLEAHLQASREAAYGRVMHRRAVEREAQLKQRLAQLEAKLRLREQQLFGRKPEAA